MEVVFLETPKPRDPLPFVNLLNLGNPFGFAIGSKIGIATLENTEGFGNQLIRAELVVFHVHCPVGVML